MNVHDVYFFLNIVHAIPVILRTQFQCYRHQPREPTENHFNLFKHGYTIVVQNSTVSSNGQCGITIQLFNTPLIEPCRHLANEATLAQLCSLISRADWVPRNRMYYTFPEKGVGSLRYLPSKSRVNMTINMAKQTVIALNSNFNSLIISSVMIFIDQHFWHHGIFGISHGCVLLTSTSRCVVSPRWAITRPHMSTTGAHPWLILSVREKNGRLFADDILIAFLEWKGYT